LRASHPPPSRGAGAKPRCRVADCGLIRPRSLARASTCRPAHPTSRRSGYRICLTKRKPPCLLDPVRGRRSRWRACLRRASRGLEGNSRLGQRQRRRGGAGGGHRNGRNACSTGSSSSAPECSAPCSCWRARSGRGHAGRGVELAPCLTPFAPQRTVEMLVRQRHTRPKPGSQSHGSSFPPRATNPTLRGTTRSPSCSS
jgi:hypothetical protein